MREAPPKAGPRSRVPPRLLEGAGSLRRAEPGRPVVPGDGGAEVSGGGTAHLVRVAAEGAPAVAPARDVVHVHGVGPSRVGVRGAAPAAERVDRCDDGRRHAGAAELVPVAPTRRAVAVV